MSIPKERLAAVPAARTLPGGVHVGGSGVAQDMPRRASSPWKAVLTVVVVALLCVPLLIADQFVLHIGVMVGIMSILAVSMNLMLRIGQLSFAQVAFMGIGAYTAALLSLKAGVPTSLALVIGGLVPSVLALLLGPIFLRIKGVYFVLLTFSFGQIVNLVFQDWISLFGGNNGLGGIPKLGLFDFKLASADRFYTFSTICAALVYAAATAIHRSNIGIVLSALDENEPLGRSLGLDAMRWRIGIFVLSAFLAGTAGGLYAYYIGFLSPPTFSFGTTVDALVMNVIGGISTPFGPILGAIILVPLPEVLRDARQYQFLIYAAILAGSLLFFREGLANYIGRLFKRKESR
ncbi:branched-chain amino acid ABC transporter permease [soil metagenome]